MNCNKYIIKEKEGIVVGILDKSSCMNVINEIAKYRVNFKFKDIDKDGSPHEYTAVAKCQDEDVFLFETGKQIVDIKVAYKYHTAMVRKYRQIIKYYRTLLKIIEKLENDHRIKAMKFDEKLKKFM